MHARQRASGRKRLMVGTGLSLGAALGMGASAEAADFTVTSTLDDGTGTTLREALQSAQDNNNSPVVDNILFQSGLSGTITLNGTELPTVDEPLFVQGPGPGTLAVSGNNASRIFSISTAGGADVTISGLTLMAGNAGDGGAAYSTNADLVIQSSTISGNTSSSRGGGIRSNTLTTIQNSTISGNYAGLAGGGISSYGVTIKNSTISGNNVSPSGAGGGIYSFSGTATIQNSTISDNHAGFAGGVSTYNSNPEPTLTNTVVADNTAATGPDLFSGGVVPDSFNASFSLIESTSGATVNETVAGSNVIGQDPSLGPLQNNGGATPTQRPAFNSPAVDKGMTAGGATTDQRGLPRPFDVPAIGNSMAAGADGADIGAVELTFAEATPPVAPPSVTPTPTTPTQSQAKKKKCKKKRKKGRIAAAAKKCKKKKRRK